LGLLVALVGVSGIAEPAVDMMELTRITSGAAPMDYRLPSPDAEDRTTHIESARISAN